MGCSSTPKTIENYSKPKINDVTALYSNGEMGPFINPNVSNIEEKMNSYTNSTYVDALIDSFKKFSNNECLGYRKEIKDKVFEDKFTFYKYNEVYQFSQNFARNLKAHKLVETINFEDEGDQNFLGIFARNSTEWMLTEIACQLNSISLVTLYNTLGEEAFAHICDLTKFSTLAISKDCVKNFIEYKTKYGLENLRNLIIFDFTLSFDKELIESLKGTGLNVLSFSDLVSKADESVPLIKSNPDTIVTICFTSGTTGLPKAPKLTQRNLFCQLDNVENIGVKFLPTDRHLSYLPLAHIMEHLFDLVILAYGGAIGFFSGDTKMLKEDLVAIKSSFLLAVPRVLKIFRDKIFEKFDEKTGCARNIINDALRVKKENLNSSNKIDHGLYDSMVFSKVRETFNANWRFILTGSAPLPIELANEIKIIFGCPLIEGYGMTECTGLATAMKFIDVKNGHVGGPVTNTMIKIVDVPEMQYTNGSGELCIKGPSVFSGYFKDVENTKKMVDDDGWLHTGDVCTLMPNKSFKIIDRVKEIFKLQQGEYIAPTKLEAVYSKSKYCSQVCIYGNSLQNFIIGIIIPNKPNLFDFLLQKGLVKQGESVEVVENFLNNPDALSEVKRDLEKLANESHFNSLEKVRHLILGKNEFTIDNGLLTSTMKMIRKKIEKYYEDEINKIYAS